MALLEVRDPATGSIKPWVWVVGAGFAIGGAALFIGAPKGDDSAEPTTGEGLGSSSGGLDDLQQALQELLDRVDNLSPDPAVTPPPTGSSSGSGIFTDATALLGREGTFTSGGTSFHSDPSTGSIGSVAPSSSTFSTIGGVNTGRTTSTADTSTTSRTAGSPTGSTNPYPISKGVNPPHQIGSTQTSPSFNDL